MNNGCQGHVRPFIGRKGLYIEGSVSPPIFGVLVKIISAGDSPSSHMRTGEVAFETETGDNGVYISGPLYDDVNYSVEAFKVSNSYPTHVLSQATMVSILILVDHCMMT